MQIPSINQISRENLPGAPEWVTNLLIPLNQLLIALIQGLNKALDSRNFDDERKALSITAGATASDNTFAFTPRKPVMPRDVYIERIFRTDGTEEVFTTPPSILGNWSLTNTGLNIYAIPNLTPDKKYDITIRVVWSI